MEFESFEMKTDRTCRRWTKQPIAVCRPGGIQRSSNLSRNTTPFRSFRVGPEVTQSFAYHPGCRSQQEMACEEVV